MRDDALRAGSVFCTRHKMEYTILMQKMKEGATVKDSLADFGVVCTEEPFIPFAEAKELASRDWSDEDGDDVYVPEQIPLAAYDIELEMCCKGNRGTVKGKMNSFRDYLTGRDGTGGEMKVYFGYSGTGRQHVYFKKLDPDVFSRSNLDESFTFTLTLRVADPVTEVTLTY